MISVNSDIKSGPHSSPPPVSTPIIDHFAKYNHKFWELLKITSRKIVQRILIEQNTKMLVNQFRISSYIDSCNFVVIEIVMIITQASPEKSLACFSTRK